jgi:hypothetical protein
MLRLQTHQVEEAAGRGHQQMSARRRGALRSLALSTVHSRHCNAETALHGFTCRGHLYRELARRHQVQRTRGGPRLGFGPAAAKRQNRQDDGVRLAAAGRRDAQHVPPLNAGRPRLALQLHRHRVANPAQELAARTVGRQRSRACRPDFSRVGPLQLVLAALAARAPHGLRHGAWNAPPCFSFM